MPDHSEVGDANEPDDFDPSVAPLDFDWEAVEVWNAASNLDAANALIVRYWCGDGPVGAGSSAEIRAAVEALPREERVALLVALGERGIDALVEVDIVGYVKPPAEPMIRPGPSTSIDPAPGWATHGEARGVFRGFLRRSLGGPRA